MTSRAEIIDTTRQWIGTPYRHQHAQKHVACDCLGLVRGVYKDLFGATPENPPPYSASWGESGKNDLLLDVAKAHLVESFEDFMPGQVLIFRMKPNVMAKHCAILSYDNKMIHAYQTVGKVVEHGFTPFWKRKVVGKFDFPGIT